jgi:hypothetical protein
MSNDYEAFQLRRFPSRKSRKRARKKLLDTFPVDRRNAFIEAENADTNETKTALSVIEKRLSNAGDYISSSPKEEDKT